MLDESIPSRRCRFTTADFDFVVATLAAEDRRQDLGKLWLDDETRRELLDLKDVFRGLLESPGALRVSPRFYFYVLVRHTFLDAGLDDCGLADYVAEVLASRIGRAGDPLQDVAGGFTHASDFLAVLSRAQGRMRFHLQVAAGNQFLVLTGLYPDFLKKRRERSGAPDLEFYESFARQSYRGAADNHLAPNDGSRRILAALADALPEARRSLNRMAEIFLFLGDPVTAAGPRPRG